jgi:hypothetical protein
VLLFYALLDRKAFEEAYQLRSARYRSTTSFETFRSGYETTEAIYVDRLQQLAGVPVLVEVSITAVDVIDGRELVHGFSGTWELVNEAGNGDWTFAEFPLMSLKPRITAANGFLAVRSLLLTFIS